MTPPVVVLGAGGHALVVVDALLAAGREVRGLTDADPERTGTFVLGVPVIGPDDDVLSMAPASVELTVGIGSIKSTQPRAALFERFCKDYLFTVIVHPSATVSAHATLEDGAQVMAGAVLQAGARVGRNVIVNTSASVDHDCDLGDHAHIAPGATLSGGVRVGDRCHIGTGATILQGVSIGAECVVAAGATVISDLPAGTTYIPGRSARQDGER